MAGEIKYSRKFPRRRFRQDVGLLHRGKYTLVQGLEIGEGGMLVKFPDSVKAGDIIAISFFISQKGFVVVLGEVVYQKPEPGQEDPSYAMGIKFIDLEFEFKRHIRDFIALKTAEEAMEENRKAA